MDRVLNKRIQKAFGENTFSYRKRIGSVLSYWFFRGYNLSIVIELDQDQYKCYDAEEEVNRLIGIREEFMDKDPKPLVVIRFNLDAFKDSGGLRIGSYLDDRYELQSWSPMDGCITKEFERRWCALEDCISRWLYGGASMGRFQHVKVERLFFDGYDTTLKDRLVSV